MLTLQVQVSYNIKYKEGFDGRAKLSDGRTNALPCPPLAKPMRSRQVIMIVSCCKQVWLYNSC